MFPRPVSGSCRPGWLLEAAGNGRPRGMAIARGERRRAIQNPAYRPAGSIRESRRSAFGSRLARRQPLCRPLPTAPRQRSLNPEDVLMEHRRHAAISARRAAFRRPWFSMLSVRAPYDDASRAPRVRRAHSVARRPRPPARDGAERAHDDVAKPPHDEARHIPVLLDEAMAALAPQSRRRLSRRHLRRRRLHARHSRARGRARAGARSRSERDSRRRRAGRSLRTAASRWSRRASASWRAIAERCGFAPLDGVVARYRRLLDAVRRGRARLLASASTARSTCAWRAAAAAPPTSSTRRSEETLADILYHYGEERASRRIARAIVNARLERPIATTARARRARRSAPSPGRPGEIHPATRTFQALRIAVNDELGELVAALAGAERMLKPGGRLVDRRRSIRSKTASSSNSSRERSGAASALAPAAGRTGSAAADLRRSTVVKPIAPSEREIAANPRARSAQLRVATRTDAPARPIDDALARLAAPARTRSRGDADDRAFSTSSPASR